MLDIGTVLDDRYRILSERQPGSFGRVYLAEDLKEGNKKVILKEFTLAVQGTDASPTLQKLSNLNHPRIAKFELVYYQQNLFLVRDYIVGKSYATLLKSKHTVTGYFTKNEILELFRQILPVLSYLHKKGVIHGNISPENIIRSNKDNLPVLIDFGVKQVATEILGVESLASQGNHNAKTTYAPDDQLKKGRFAPDSDLYALAASALYLMTGKEPKDLWDVPAAKWIKQKKLTLRSPLKEALNKMLAAAPEQRFQSAEEVLRLLDNKTIVQSNMSRNLVFFFAGVGVTALAAVGAIAFFPVFKPQPQRNLTLGFLAIPNFPNQKYELLADYLKTELGNKLKTDKLTIIVDAIDTQSTTSLLDAKNRIADKKWDIAFTVNPMLSVEAKKNGYTFAARMWPGIEQIQSVLFVRGDSSIKNIADLTPDKIIALGQPGDAVTYSLPLYNLYGKTLTIDKRNSVNDIIEKVKSGQADIGAGYLNRIKEEPKLRLFGFSRSIPLSGVYLSPNISEKEQNLIKETLLNAAPNVRNQTNYEQGEEPDYSNFIGINNRVIEILSCTKFDQNPVNLYCDRPQNIIQGKVDGVFPVANDKHELTLQTEKDTYKVILPNSYVGAPLELNGKIIQVIDVKPKEVSGTLVLEITQPKQIKVKD
ncbi:PhnD/SsuA/transferrin family substrate-binding protein [Aerosakkonema sp. BLCC-F183]|uniref:protein kinase domain-containing protein n=1 Tax=Aerosakkonema sp. BLCC-F183 TaxID=3342834 RepID=UPI0035B7ABB1